MGYKANFKGWDQLTIEDLLIAYRKAKADCFFENTFPTAIKFAEYEQDLLANLERLLSLLKRDSGFESNENLLGTCRLLPKKLSKKKKDGCTENGHVHFSKPERAVEDLFKNFDITPEFRIVGDFPVDTHIISALWINMIGHQFDAKLDDSCYGARLKRIRNDEPFSEDDDKPFHISSIGSFVPYFQPYQKWRNDGLKAIRDELEKDRDVLAVSLDLKSYYHFIDPLALTGKALTDKLNLELDDEEKEFTGQLAKFLNNWSDKATEFGGLIGGSEAHISGGLVIGLTCSRIISNALLHKWDRMVFEHLSPIHYGRYVDDMFLVLRDTGTVTNSINFMQMLQKHMGQDCISQDSANKQVWQISQGENIQANSHITLQSDKQKLFILQGRAGLDLLDSIEKEIYELSSEHRLMPSPDQLEHSTAAKVLSAAGNVRESADTLRKANGLTIRRLGWSLQLRHVETLARDLPPNQWKEQRDEFYQFAHNHILRADNLFEHFNYLPRLLGFAISMNEWEQAKKIAEKAYQAIDTLMAKVSKERDIKINGCTAKVQENSWSYIKGTLTWLFIDAAARYYDPNQLFLNELPKKENSLSKLFEKHILNNIASFIEQFFDQDYDVADIDKKAPLIAISDLAKEPYKQLSTFGLVENFSLEKGNEILEILNKSGFIDSEIFYQFIDSVRKKYSPQTDQRAQNSSLLPYIFPTRPLTAIEISERSNNCLTSYLDPNNDKTNDFLETWAKYVHTLRGNWVRPELLLGNKADSQRTQTEKDINFIKVGKEQKNKIIIALTNIRLEDEDWAKTACNTPNLSRERYESLAKLVNETLNLKPRPDYVIFPELSIPLKWVDSISAKLNASGISLIAGTEYRHYAKDQLISEAVLVLSDSRLGYPAFVKIWQPKLEPAVGEDYELTSKIGKKWAFSKISKSKQKPVYVHNGFNFGVMICSELLNSKARIRFQGAVDALMVLSWNRDLDTFSSLIESAALDVHAYTILVNNRKYGDSRVRSPAKESFRRDIARLRGGDNDFVVAATLDIKALREFQSRAKRWPEEGDKFKPLPEGYVLAATRKVKPPK